MPLYYQPEPPEIIPQDRLERLDRELRQHIRILGAQIIETQGMRDFYQRRLDEQCNQRSALWRKRDELHKQMRVTPDATTAQGEA